MPYERVGAMKISNHHVRGPMINLNNACQTCHKWPEEELKARIDTSCSGTRRRRRIFPRQRRLHGMRVAAAAFRHRRAAIAALAAGNDRDALKHALEPMSLQRTESGGELAFLARLLAKGA